MVSGTVLYGIRVTNLVTLIKEMNEGVYFLVTDEVI
jgi:hypothetical protein